ncbi:MAG: hypothetical protein KAS02_02020 [Candidatus Pacebacteria bacterium]|nr:hypothetical protein [Candidatus Paceibacterota bacterium]
MSKPIRSTKSRKIGVKIKSYTKTLDSAQKQLSKGALSRKSRKRLRRTAEIAKGMLSKLRDEIS